MEKGTRPAMPSCGTVVGAASDSDIEFFFFERDRGEIYVGFLGARIEYDTALSGAMTLTLTETSALERKGSSRG